MLDLKLKLKNFLSIREADLRSKNNITILIAPNRAGKTQIMLLLYSIFWSYWKISKENLEKNNKDFENILKRKIKDVFLLKNIDELKAWDKKTYNIELNSQYTTISFFGEPFKLQEFSIEDFKFFEFLQISPLYMQLSGLGDYYKGIYSLKKYYPHWKLISEAITDLLSDLFIISSEKVETNIEKENQELLNLFEKLFNSKFYIQDERIYIQEKGKKYGIEKTASGLKALSLYYLILKYNLMGNILFIDEPEVNLHPIYIDKLAEFLYKLSKGRKLFIATHSDYLIESFNKLISKNNFKIDVWEGVLKEDGAVYSCYEADKDNLIDNSPLTEVYLNILKEGFGYE
ncbi:AAA family ATPase [Venenivibrio stagnispumantis]|uniref:Predicted ATPase n=1 Tax=Venenivibrio stagnispumantis TaxID=407998 RepID=A0AA46ADP0_9AQUI|nr:AAA family ATPase [Venenivibrio stagnispumantis]MCW4573498.1 AAA family ATPase [Venenivibrio stagnispumantis]SMP06585.1 Predicted ATPase [Venenivibrio stagnispumantis]